LLESFYLRMAHVEVCCGEKPAECATKYQKSTDTGGCGIPEKPESLESSRGCSYLINTQTSTNYEQ